MTEAVVDSHAVSGEPPDAGANDPDPQAVESGDVVDPQPVSDPVDEGKLTAGQQERVRQMIQQRDNQWNQHVQGLQQARNGDAAAQAKADTESDTRTKEIRALYANDEVGQRTFDAIEKHLELRAVAGEKVTMADVRRVSDESANTVRNQVQSGVAITNEVKALRETGVLGTMQEQKVVEQEYTNRLQDPQMAQAASTPIGAEMILKGVVYDCIKAGKVKPGTKPKPPESPFSPSGPGSSPQAPAPVDHSQSPFAGVRALTADQAKSADATSIKNFAGGVHGQI